MKKILLFISRLAEETTNYMNSKSIVKDVKNIECNNDDEKFFRIS
jgi:hypothetical protein